MIDPAEAERLVLDNMPEFPAQDCPIAEAHGRVLRREIRADRDLPPFDRATLDGFAVRHAALASGMRRFRVDGLQAAGSRALPLGPDSESCVEIMTGAPIPEGADAVVPYEEAQRDGAHVVVADPAAGRAGRGVHRKGSDRREGETVLAPGARLTGPAIAVAASCGHAAVSVTRLPRIAVVATGDELVEVGEALAPHQIRRSNDYAIRAALAGAGYPSAERFHARDSRESVRGLLERVLETHDVVVATGGVSKGKFDFVASELAALGVKKIFHEIAQRPGRPIWFGTGPGGVPVFALPGNPVSSLVCLCRYAIPALDRASGLSAAPLRTVALAAPVASPTPDTGFLPVRLGVGPGAVALATPVAGNTSGDFAGLVGTDGFVELPPGTGAFSAGHVARFWAW